MKTTLCYEAPGSFVCQSSRMSLTLSVSGMPSWIITAVLGLLTGPAGAAVSLETTRVPENLPSDTSVVALVADSDAGACNIKSLRKSGIQGLRRYSHDGSQYIINKEDASGIAQIYVGTSGSSELRCITCTKQSGGPKPDRFKMQPNWHPSGRWIFLAVERENYSTPPILGWSRKFVEGMLQSGIWTNMYAVSPDGTDWHRLTDFKSGVVGVPDGYTGPHFTSDGKRAVWSQIVDGNIFKYWPFGRWELILADFEENNGVPSFRNLKDITPEGMHWNETGGGFGSDDVTLLFSGSTEKDAQGMDQYLLNIENGKLTNLTNSPTVWDEHGVFSPDGEKIIFMSAYPYRSDPNSSKIASIKTEFMLMNKDGSGLTQLTHFFETGYPEYSNKGGIAATPEWSSDGGTAYLAQLFFPDYEYWELLFEGPCGRGGTSLRRKPAWRVPVQ